MTCKSCLLKFKVPPENLPIDDPPTPRSLRPVFDLVTLVGFSKIMPFSFASFRRLSSFEAALALIPRLCESGIFCL